MYSLKISPKIQISWGKKYIKVEGPLGFVFKTRGILLPVVKNSRLYFLQKKKYLFLFYALMKLLIKGLLLGFRKKLKLVGVGYRGYHLENFLVLKIGYSHEVFYFIPFDIKLICFKSRGWNIFLKGIEKYRVNQTAVDIRALQAPDVYKGKGIRYKDEIILLKKGKEEPSN